MTTTLVAICEGVKDAINEMDKSGTPASINPYWMGEEASWEKNVEKAEFDVVVTAADKMSGGGKAGVKVFSVVDVGAQLREVPKKVP